MTGTRARRAAERRVLVVYSRVGGGHLSAARALGSALEAADAGGPVRVRLVDAYVECGRAPVTAFPVLYAWLARAHPRLWGALFHASNRAGPWLGAGAVLRPFLAPGLGRRVAAERPHVVVSVLPLINGLLAEARVAGPRVEVVLTDWSGVHRSWVAPGVDHYTAPTGAARLDCLRFGAPPGAVEVVGLPVRREFVAPAAGARAAVLGGLGLDPGRFTILAMAGAEGSPRTLANLRALLGLAADTQVVVVCGRNAPLRQRVAALPARAATRVVGFVDDVAGLMRATDLLVTKAGGITLAEAFCCGVPVVVGDALPGQEAGNLGYVLRREAAAYAPSPACLAALVAALREDAGRRRALAERGRALARPDAAARIAAGLLARLRAQGRAPGAE